MEVTVIASSTEMEVGNLVSIPAASASGSRNLEI